MKPKKPSTESIPDYKHIYESIPQKGGVYMMLNSKKQVIYVGKSKNLRSRVRSYFFSSSGFKNQFLIRQIDSIDYILTQTDAESYLLEASLIKKHNPRYNIRLKDDKAYPYIYLSLKDKFPRLYLERKVKKDDRIYFGPYTQGSIVKNMIQLLNETYQIRDCSDAFMKSRKSPCLTYHMGSCSAPCVGNVSEKAYARQVKKVLSFMKGDGSRFVKKIKTRMKQESQKENFERALELKNKMDSVESFFGKQFVIDAEGVRDCDVLSQYENKDFVVFEILHIRSGRLIGHLSHFDRIWVQSKKAVEKHFVRFLIQYYSQNLIPKEIIVPQFWSPRLLKGFQSAFVFLSQKQPLIHFPTKQNEKQWSQMAFKNAQDKFKTQIEKFKKTEEALLKIQKVFHLPRFPYRIECFDVSHHQSKSSYASQVVFENGVAKKEDYRLYKLPEVNDDYGSMKTCLTRRFSEEKLHSLPDLLLIDGGKGQLQVVFKILKSQDLSLPIVAVAKPLKNEKHEKFYLPMRKNSVYLSEFDEAFKLLIRIRDEAHRFALTAHRKKLRAQSFESSLTQVKGIGEKRKVQLLKKFKSLQGIQKAGSKKVSQELKISLDLSKKIISSLKK